MKLWVINLSAHQMIKKIHSLFKDKIKLRDDKIKVGKCAITLKKFM